MNKMLIFLSFVVIIIMTLVVRTILFPFTKTTTAVVTGKMEVSELSIKRFAEGLSFATISEQNYEETNFAEFEAFQLFMERAYPEVYMATEHYTIDTYSMVFRWKGKNAALKPILFLSHYDVVPPGDFSYLEHNEMQTMSFDLDDEVLPAATTIAETWDYPPFSGAVAKGRIYGRGALDMKNMLFSIMEATDTLIKRGFVPERDIYLAFGHDEEVGGAHGASKVAEDFAKKGLQFDAIYDEGGIIAAKGSLKGINDDIALIGFAEKGSVSYSVKVKGLGGHSSMPPLQTAMGKAAIIMQRLEEQQMKQDLTEPIKDFLKNTGGSMSFSSRVAIANQWLLESILLSALEKAPATNALTRTTTALTMMKGSDANNVLPPIAEFVVNFRILPTNTIDDVFQHVTKACEGFDVTIEEYRPPQKPSKISAPDGRAYQVMQETMLKVFPSAIVSPFITIGGTDAVKYENLSDHIYRFSPVLLTEAEQRSIHNQNEYISIENYGRMILYFESIMSNYDLK